MPVRHDLHIHSTYSDGWDMAEMASAATEAGLSTLGVADHCPVGEDPFGRRDRYDLVNTYGTRRDDLAAVAADTGVAMLDAAEINFDPRKEDRIRAFLHEAEFTYTIGSVHFVRDHDIAQPDLAGASESERLRVVDEYVDWLIALVESELCDILGHLDLPQRAPPLRGLMDETHYTRIANALSESGMTPELNAGRVDRTYGTIHPHPEALPIFAERDIRFVAGSDAHAPDQLQARLSGLSAILEDLPVEYTAYPRGLARELNSR